MDLPIIFLKLSPPLIDKISLFVIEFFLYPERLTPFFLTLEKFNCVSTFFRIFLEVALYLPLITCCLEILPPALKCS